MPVTRRSEGKVGTVARGRTARWAQLGRRLTPGRGESGQTMPLILGIVLVLSLGTVVLVQNTFQQFPIVTKDVIQHEAYRAMESGLDEYLYAVNANANFAACNATFVNGSGVSQGASALTSASTRVQRAQLRHVDPCPEAGPPTGHRHGSSSTTRTINISTGNVSIDIVGRGWLLQRLQLPDGRGHAAAAQQLPAERAVDELRPDRPGGGGPVQQCDHTDVQVLLELPEPQHPRQQLQASTSSLGLADRKPVRQRHGLRVRNGPTSTTCRRPTLARTGSRRRGSRSSVGDTRSRPASRTASYTS